MEVLNVYITKHKFIISTYDGALEIPRVEFDEWVIEEQKREWLEVYADHNGDPVESGGTLSWRDYYKTKSFFKDIEEYIELKKLKPQK